MTEDGRGVKCDYIYIYLALLVGNSYSLLKATQLLLGSSVPKFQLQLTVSSGN